MISKLQMWLEGPVADLQDRSTLVIAQKLNMEEATVQAMVLELGYKIVMAVNACSN